MNKSHLYFNGLSFCGMKNPQPSISNFGHVTCERCGEFYNNVKTRSRRIKTLSKQLGMKDDDIIVWSMGI